jgi:hypothetical protein
MDWSVLAPWLCASLNAPSIAELGQWTETELYRYAEEALHDIGGRYVLFAEYDDSIALVPEQALYELPTLHIATIYAAASGETLQLSSIAEMEMLDDNWEAALSDTPARAVADALGVTFIGVYPPPHIEGGVLDLIYQRHPPDMTPPTLAAPLTATVLMPAPVGDYLAHKTLEAARTRQGDGQMLDAAEAFRQLSGVYERAFKEYWS